VNIFHTYDEQMAWYRGRAEVYKAVAHPVRIQLVELLTGGEMSVGGLEDQLELPQSQISQHLRVLRQAGLVQSRRMVTAVFYKLTDPKLAVKLRIVTEDLVE
jgi:DNA-binding transcriptional ArsR family regulator